MKHFDRGNAVPETALAVSFTLLVLFGITQLATTTFYQVSADGASFVGSHDTVANLGSPTSANQSDAASAAAVAFSKIVKGSVSVLNPTNTTFETDIAQQVPGISALGNPTALTINSRLIEESAGSASGSQLPPAALDCSQQTENIVDKGNASALATAAPILNAAIGVTQAAASVVPITVAGGTALSYNPAPVVNELTLLNGVETDLNQTVTTLKTLPTLINSTLGTIPGTSGLVSALESAVSTGLEAPVASALTGVFNQANALASVNASIKNVPGVGTILYNLVAPAIDALLTGGATGTGILGGKGPLATLAAAETAVDTLDQHLPTCPNLPALPPVTGL